MGVEKEVLFPLEIAFPSKRTNFSLQDLYHYGNKGSSPLKTFLIVEKAHVSFFQMKCVFPTLDKKLERAFAWYTRHLLVDYYLVAFLAFPPNPVHSSRSFS